MRAITVRQPWAWAIVHGGKDVENRTRNIAGAYRGPVAIHAGVAPYEAGNAASRAHSAAHGSETPTSIVFGGIVGVVDLVDAHHGHLRSAPCSPWAMDDHWHLLLRNARPLAEPIPWRGQLGLWTLPDDAVLAVTS